MESKKTKYDMLRMLICELVDGTITPERAAALNQMLAHDSEAVNHYVEFLDIQVLIQSNLSNIEADLSTPLYSDEIQELKELWHQLAEEESSAPEVMVSEVKPARELIQKVVYPERERRHTSRFSIYFLVLNAAAVLFFFVFLRLVSPKGYEVATLTDNLNAQWSDMGAFMENGTRIVTGHKSLFLEKGYAELLFDTNARIVIEGPAEFQVLAEDRIGLLYGRLYSYVPKEAAGFSVYSHNVKVIDIGTEFGVEVDSEGSTQLHVLQGKTILIAGDQLNKVSVEVGKGAAKKVSFHTQTVSETAYRDNLFARDIDSRNALVWRGEAQISLADIVGGGNGFGTGRLNHGILMDTAKLSTGPVFIGDYNVHHRVPQNSFRPVPDISAIDGVFVPDGQAGAVVVSSEGHKFEGCPSTSSTWCVPIINGGRYQSDSDAFQIRGQTYGTTETGALFLHSNAGITYDLDVIRSTLPAGKKLTHFASVGSVLDSSPYGEPGLADVWVLVDGQVRFSKINVAPSECFDIDIPLRGESRFLSLVVTDGVADRSDAKRNKDGFDWFLFGTPILAIE